ncbi:26S proteasome non-ATPase regulatory subunit 10 [Hordeum vulgare]|nr:26S proteasome non-ATPase regulatory subunit 10 [Hordeum vulgare]KAI5001115.1 hypothetical protein ZWY2020_011074 [Hordeum vulgare]
MPAPAPSSLPPPASEVPSMVAAAMEVDTCRDNSSEKELFVAAESGPDNVFTSLAPADLFTALSLRNKDDRSLIHVAAASSQPKASAAASPV